MYIYTPVRIVPVIMVYVIVQKTKFQHLLFCVIIKSWKFWSMTLFIPSFRRNLHFFSDCHQTAVGSVDSDQANGELVIRIPDAALFIVKGTLDYHYHR